MVQKVQLHNSQKSEWYKKWMVYVVGAYVNIYTCVLCVRVRTHTTHTYICIYMHPHTHLCRFIYIKISDAFSNESDLCQSLPHWGYSNFSNELLKSTSSVIIILRRKYSSKLTLTIIFKNHIDGTTTHKHTHAYAHTYNPVVTFVSSGAFLGGFFLPRKIIHILIRVQGRSPIDWSWQHAILEWLWGYLRVFYFYRCDHFFYGCDGVCYLLFIDLFMFGSSSLFRKSHRLRVTARNPRVTRWQ